MKFVPFFFLLLIDVVFLNLLSSYASFRVIIVKISCYLNLLLLSLGPDIDLEVLLHHHLNVACFSFFCYYYLGDSFSSNCFSIVINYLLSGPFQAFHDHLGLPVAPLPI